MASRYGKTHQRIRRALMTEMVGKPCARCGVALKAEDEVDLDHAEDGSYLGLAHSACNRRAGALKGALMRRKPRHSRDW